MLILSRKQLVEFCTSDFSLWSLFSMALQNLKISQSYRPPRYLLKDYNLHLLVVKGPWRVRFSENKCIITWVFVEKKIFPQTLFSNGVEKKTRKNWNSAFWLGPAVFSNFWLFFFWTPIRKNRIIGFSNTLRTVDGKMIVTPYVIQVFLFLLICGPAQSLSESELAGFVELITSNFATLLQNQLKKLSNL